jgi:hypothetical protein
MVSAKGAPDPAALLEQLAELIAAALAPKLAAELATVHAAPAVDPPRSRRLLTLNELVAQLPAGKKPATWKRWLYERTRRGLVPGCHKLGTTLFFDPEQTLPWLLAGGQRDGSQGDWMSTGSDGTVDHVPEQTTDRKKHG